METYYAVCVGLATAALVAGMTVLVVTLLQLRKTAQKVEVLTDHVDEKVEALKEAGHMVEHFSSTVRSGWVKGLEIAIGLASVLRGHNSEEAEAKPAPEEEGSES